MSPKEVKIIDYSIIWKSFQGKLSTEEEQFLSDWLKEDKRHAEFFDNAKKYFENGSSFDIEPYDKIEGWNEITANIHNSEPKRGRYQLWIAASFVVVISAVVFLLNRNDTTPGNGSKPVPPEMATTIEPGSSVATLLIDGTVSHALTQGLDTSFTTNQSVLKTKGATLKYQTRDEAIERIATNTLITPKGGEFSVILSDGTKVWLNADSRLSYPEIFRGKVREVNLIGEAYFEVAHNAEQPFIVSSGAHTIRVLGTSFNISAYPDEVMVTTTLVEGKVMIGYESILESGQQSKYQKETGELEIAVVDVYQYVSWKSKIFYFEDRPLGDIMQILSRWYDFEYVIENPEKRSLLFSGGFKRHDSFKSIIEKIELTDEVNFELSEGKVLVQ